MACPFVSQRRFRICFKPAIWKSESFSFSDAMAAIGAEIVSSSSFQSSMSSKGLRQIFDASSNCRKSPSNCSLSFLYECPRDHPDLRPFREVARRGFRSEGIPEPDSAAITAFLLVSESWSDRLISWPFREMSATWIVPVPFHSPKTGRSAGIRASSSSCTDPDGRPPTFRRTAADSSGTSAR